MIPFVKGEIATADKLNGNFAGKAERVPSIATLRTLAVPQSTDADTVIVQGYAAMGDGGGGVFAYIPGYTVADNGGTVIMPNSAPASGRWVRLFDGAVNVKWFGAKADAVYNTSTQTLTGTDDSQAFINAYAASDNVYAPAGNYRVSSKLVFGRSSAHFFGAGREKTCLMYDGSDAAIYAGDPNNQTFYSKFHDFSVIVTNHTTPANAAIDLENLVHFALDSIHLVGACNPNLGQTLAGNGIRLHNGCFIGNVRQVRVELFNYGAYTYQVNGNHTGALKFGDQCEFHNNNWGVVVGDTTSTQYDGNGTSFTDITVEGNYQGGILLRSGNAVYIRGYFESNGGYDVQVGDSANTNTPPIGTTIATCLMTSSSMSGYPYTAKIRVAEGTDTVIENNSIIAQAGIKGIILDAGSTNTMVRNNRITAVDGVAATLVDNGTGTKVRDNPDIPHHTWQTPTLLNSWVADTNYDSPQYTITPDKEVILKGAVTGGAAGTVIFNLPTGYIPSAKKEFSVLGLGSNVAITNGGAVVCTQKQTGTIGLEGVRFFLN